MFDCAVTCIVIVAKIPHALRIGFEGAEHDALEGTDLFMQQLP